MSGSDAVAWPLTFEDLNPSAPPKGAGPYHCHDCGASISDAQVDRTLIADWAFCPDCWTMLLYLAAKSATGEEGGGGE